METNAGYLYGWDSTNSKWIRITVDTTGRVKVSTS